MTGNEGNEFHKELPIIQCNYCEKSFSRKDKLTRHLRICQSFKDSTAYEDLNINNQNEKEANYQNESHLSIPSIQCNYCLKYFSNKGNVMRHLRACKLYNKVSNQDNTKEQSTNDTDSGIITDKNDFTNNILKRSLSLEKSSDDGCSSNKKIKTSFTDGEPEFTYFQSKCKKTYYV